MAARRATSGTGSAAFVDVTGTGLLKRRRRHMSCWSVSRVPLSHFAAVAWNVGLFAGRARPRASVVTSIGCRPVPDFVAFHRRRDMTEGGLMMLPVLGAGSLGAYFGGASPAVFRSYGDGQGSAEGGTGP